jgi:hypothetical protein
MTSLDAEFRPRTAWTKLILSKPVLDKIGQVLRVFFPEKQGFQASERVLSILSRVF